MPELTESTCKSNKPCCDKEEAKNDSNTESDSDDSIPELEDAGGAGQNAGTAQTQVLYVRDAQLRNGYVTVRYEVRNGRL